MKAFYEWCYILWGGSFPKDVPLKREFHQCYSVTDTNICALSHTVVKSARSQGTFFCYGNRLINTTKTRMCA